MLARCALGAMLVAALLLLSVIGLATVHSASSELAIDYLPRQGSLGGVGDGGLSGGF